ICVFTDPIMLSQGGSLWIWYTAFFICMLSLISMIVSSVFILKSDYDNIKKELSITQRVSSAEFTASMLLHGLKNQLLSANILAKKLATGLDAEEADKDKLVETAHKLYEINTEMSEKLSYLYKSVDSVKTVLKKISVDEFSKMLKTKVAIKDTSSIVSYAITDGYIMADAELLSEALVNIISNAIEAVEKINSRKLVIVRISFTRNHALITIIDNGMGMKDDMKDKIFMPFTSSKNSTTNWGLGLCYARRIIKQHRGDIRFTSKEGKGTTFYITLPMVGSKGEK
ncbi:MAG: ATP-binding protein, partial [Bacillota bacterium]